MKNVVANGSMKSKVRQFYNTKYGVLAYLYLRQYYDMDSRKRVHGHTQLENLLQIELQYNSLVGFDDYLSNLKDMFQKLEECSQGLSDEQQHTFLLNEIMYEE